MKVLFLLILFCASSFAQDEKKLLENRFYLSLLEDFAVEAESGEFAPKDSPEVKKFVADWKKFVAGETTKNPTAAPGFPWSNRWPPGKVYQAATEVGKVKEIPVKDLSSVPHTLPSPEAYSKNRLGVKTYDLIKGDEVDTVVYAGFEDSFAAWQKTEGGKLHRIPSLYETWGISKFVDLSDEAKPKLFYVIPPIQEYAHHYAALLGIPGDVDAKVILNQTDREGLKVLMREEGEKIINRLPTKPDYLVLGYQKQWQEVLGDAEQKFWRIEKIQDFAEVSDGVYDPKLSAKLMTLVHKQRPGVRKTFLSLGADSTLWGEATSFMVEPFLKLKPKAVFFGGSAGAFDESVKTYSAIAPERFSVNGKIVDLENGFRSALVDQTDQRGVELRKVGLHGRSNSPAEQTVDYVQKMKAMGVSSVDVEQSLLAETIQNYNESSGTKINYFAMNLVTDRPGSLAEHGYHLDNIDQATKGKVRYSIVESILQASDGKLGTPAPSLDELDALRKKMILKAFPQITEDQIHIKNGLGRVDVRKDVKFSYYIFTDNPHQLNSKTTLIPMATSRYTPTYYHTDEWWDANKEQIDAAKRAGEPMPRQDPEEVKAWLKKHNLSTNPDVFHIGLADESLKSSKLQDFLLQEYLKKNVVNGNVVLYRGAEKLTEIGEWKNGIRPRGIRYWTPDVTYAWRYGRKHPEYLKGLLNGDVPVLKFEIPVDTFIEMVKNRELTLGTELTKKVHDNFDARGVFVDQLNNNEHYLGNADWGVEFEVRANRSGSNKFTQFYKGPVPIAEMAEGFKKNLTTGLARLSKQFPEEQDTFRKILETRTRDIDQERTIIEAVRAKKSAAEIQPLIASLNGRQLSNFDGGDLKSMALEEAKKIEDCSVHFHRR